MAGHLVEPTTSCGHERTQRFDALGTVGLFVLVFQNQPSCKSQVVESSGFATEYLQAPLLFRQVLGVSNILNRPKSSQMSTSIYCEVAVSSYNSDSAALHDGNRGLHPIYSIAPPSEPIERPPAQLAVGRLSIHMRGHTNHMRGHTN